MRSCENATRRSHINRPALCRRISDNPTLLSRNVPLAFMQDESSFCNRSRCVAVANYRCNFCAENFATYQEHDEANIFEITDAAERRGVRVACGLSADVALGPNYVLARGERRWFLLSSCENSQRSVPSPPPPSRKSCEIREKRKTGPTFAHTLPSGASQPPRRAAPRRSPLQRIFANSSIQQPICPFLLQRTYTGHGRSGIPDRKALIIISRGEISN